MKCTSVFDKNIQAWDAGENLIFNQGGTRSSKTYSLLQLFFLIALKSKEKLILSVVSYALPHLKLGAMRDFEKILLDYNYPLTCKNISESYFKIGNSIVEFFGVENLGKVHGPERDYLLINECNFIKYKIYEQLAIRTRRTIFCDFNPSVEFWYHTDVRDKEKHLLIKSTYLDNEHLTPQQIERIESKKNNVYWWQVYGLGELGRQEGAIFQNWEYGVFDDTLPFIHGLDFGVKDPDACVKIAVDKKRKIIYVHEVFYQSGNGTNELYELTKNLNYIIADSASNRTILDLKKLKVNIEPVVKNKIVEDVKLINDYKIIITDSSYNLARELNSWVWLDKKGEVTSDDNNHLIDALRYATSKFIRGVEVRTHRLLRR